MSAIGKEAYERVTELERRVKDLEFALYDTMRFAMHHVHPPAGPASADQEHADPFDSSFEVLEDRASGHLK